MRSFFKLLCAVLLVGLLPVSALAREAPDLDKTGSIQVILRDTETKEEVPGGELILYRVGEAVEDDGDYFFRAAGDFADCGLTLETLTSEELESAELAQKLADYAKDHAKGTTLPVLRGGVTFEKQDVGLYLVVQATAADGYEKVNPFLVTIPMQEDGVFKYDVDASPKTSVKKAPPTTTTPPKDSTLPQTGQLNWPVPVLTIAGLLFFAVGWMLCFGRRRGGHAK